MKYLGRAEHTPPDGWTLHSFRDDWVGAPHINDPQGPRIFKPTTVRLAGAEYERFRDSLARHQADPVAERRQVGRFWESWILQTDGRFTRRSERQTYS